MTFFFLGGSTEAAQKNPQRVTNPVMEVKIGTAKQKNKFTSNGAFVVETEDGKIKMRLKKYQHVSISYKDGVYSVVRGNKTVTAKKPLRVTPLYPHKKVTVINFENRPAWNENINDNVFFGSMEVVYSENSDETYLVNHIGIERYVRGIGEVTNDQSEVYLKTLLTAARTYALWHIKNPTKYAEEPYILTATDGDQIYKGANFSKRAPNVVAAQKATKTKIVTYNGVGIIAPYFSQSDGRTRAWSEVFGGEYAWAQAVDDPCCTTDTLRGHGVGLSGEGARYFADKGWGYKKILKYYYSGVKIKSGY